MDGSSTLHANWWNWGRGCSGSRTTTVSIICGAEACGSKRKRPPAEPDFLEPDDTSERAIGPAIDRILLSLPPKERACVLLKDVFEYSLEEIAELVDSTVGGVKPPLNRARTKLASAGERSAPPPVQHRNTSRSFFTSSGLTSATGMDCAN
jgi:Sigma-70, region 4